MKSKMKMQYTNNSKSGCIRAQSWQLFPFGSEEGITREDFLEDVIYMSLVVTYNVLFHIFILLHHLQKLK